MTDLTDLLNTRGKWVTIQQQRIDYDECGRVIDVQEPTSSMYLRKTVGIRFESDSSGGVVAVEEKENPTCYGLLGYNGRRETLTPLHINNDQGHKGKLDLNVTSVRIGKEVLYEYHHNPNI